MNWEMVSGVIRHILTFGGGFLVTKGLVDDGTLQAAIGAIITLGGVAWSLFQKKATSA